VNKAVSLVLALLLLGGLSLAQNLTTTCNRPGAVLGYSNEELFQIKQSDPERYIQILDDMQGLPPADGGSPEYMRGPDADGYVYKDSDQPGGPTYAWDTFYTNQATGDDAIISFNYGWNFTYRGTTWNSIYMSTNGYITFGNSSNYLSGDTFPSTSGPNNMVGGFWGDLYCDGAPGYLRYGTTGTAPNRRVVVTWDSVRFYSPSTPYRFQFQIILYESGNQIVAQYKWANSDGSWWQYRNTMRSGMENYNGTIGLNLPNSLLKNNYAVKYGQPILAHDASVTRITGPAGLYCICDTLWPKAMVKNYGTSDESDIPVRCVIWDGATQVYDQTVHVSADAGETVEAEWTTPLWPLEHDADLVDSVWTELSTDEEHGNDTASSAVTVNVQADVTMSYNDGETGANGCYTWTTPNYSVGVRFPGPCPVGKFSVGLSGYSTDPGGPYPCTCKVRENAVRRPTGNDRLGDTDSSTAPAVPTAKTTTC